MTWSAETSCGHESYKIAHLVVPYTRGRCLDLGCGASKLWPCLIGVDNNRTFGETTSDITADVADLSLFADQSMDGVFSSHTLEDFAPDRVLAVLKEWWRVLKIGGYLTLYLPHADLYPHIGEKGCNPAHKWEPTPELVLDYMRHLDGGWTLLENEVRDKRNEYSFLMVFRKECGSVQRHRVWERHPMGRKRALVIRFGGIGDSIIASSILPGLQRQDYHVTYQTTIDSAKVLAYDPHINEFMYCDRDQVPNQALGAYWDAMDREERFDKTINLCESLEEAALVTRKNIMHRYPQRVRTRMLRDLNYLEHVHEIAEVPPPFLPKFYPTANEAFWTRRERGKYRGCPVVAWAIYGSTHHKAYPWLPDAILHLQQAISGVPVQVVLMGDKGQGEELQDGILRTLERSGADMSRVHGMSGKWSIRESLAFVQMVDCVVGPETGLLNAVCMEEVPKVIYLSHSSPENLTKHWKNATVLTPTEEQCPCYPCHILHQFNDWSKCSFVKESGAALCATSIKPEAIMRAIAEALGAGHASRAA